MREHRIRALAFLDKYEPKGRQKASADEHASAESGSALPGFVPSESVEILPPAKPSATSLVAAAPAPLSLPLPPRPADITPQLDAMVRRLDDLLQGAARTFDLGEPEGFLDTWVFERPDHRISVKVARSTQALQLVENFAKTLDAAGRADEKIRVLNRAQQQEYIEGLRLARTALEEYHRLQHAVTGAERQEQIDAAKARAALALLERQARDAASDLRPASAQAVLPARDPAAERREEARRKRWETLDLDLDEAEDHASAAEEKLARAKDRCVAIYRDVKMREGEKRVRIQKVLDEFGFDWSILPVAIEDLMSHGYEEVAQ